VKKLNKYVGLDVHKETSAVAVADERGGEPRYWGEIENRPFEGPRTLAQQIQQSFKLRVFALGSGRE
jgi:hypothetical protein